jgi:hypothetical protein
MMKQSFTLALLVLLFKTTFLFAQKSEDRQLWMITARISHNSTFQVDTTSTFMAGPKKWTKESHQSSKETVSGTITAIVENQAENPAKDFLYHSDSGEPVSISVTGNGSSSESGNSQETIDGVLISADIRTDNVSGSARPGASLYFEYSDENKSFDAGMGIKAVGSYHGRMYSGGIGYGEWKDYGGDYKDYSLSCGGGGDALTDKNCKISKTGNGYQGSWKESENKLRHTPSGPEYTTTVTTVEITVMPYKEPDKPEVTLLGCSDLGNEEQSNVIATGKPEGGKFRFWVEPGNLFNVEADGESSANLTGATPGKGTLYVEYTTPEGKTNQTSQAASCVKIENYNGGQPIPQIALYDIDGKKLQGIKTVPVDAQPENASELVKFEPADPGVLTATGIGGEVTLQGLRPGTTTLQAKTKCGETSGPSVEVEVVNCDDETIATLERMKKAATENLVEATERLQKEAGSPEFEKARDELVSSTRELLAKAALTIIANGKSPTTVIKVAAEIADKGSALSEAIASSTPEEMKDNIGKTAAGDSFEKIVEKQFGEKIGDLWGKSLSAAIAVAEVQQAAQKFGENIGEILKHDDVMEGLTENYEKAMRDYKRIDYRQQFCKKGNEQPQSKEQPKSDPTSKPKEPTQPKEPSPKPDPTTGDQSKPTEPTPTEPKSDDEVIGDPEPPIVPPKQVGLPYEPSDCGCNQSKELIVKSADFSSMSTGMKNLGDCVENFRSISLTDYQNSLQEISTMTDSLSTSLKTNAEAFLVKAKASKPRLDNLVNRVKAYDKAGTEFVNTMNKCPESVTTGMEIFQSVEKITVDSIKTHY